MSQQISPGDRAKRKRADDSSSEFQSDSCSEESRKKKKKRKHDRSSVKKKHKKEKKKSSSKETKKNKKLHKRHKTALDEEIVGPTVTITRPAVAMAEPREAQRSLGPMTKEQYEKRQSTTRRVFDEDTGRYRLIKGDGEIVEEIVSKQRQQQINKLATAGDGMSFQSGLTQFYK